MGLCIAKVLEGGDVPADVDMNDLDDMPSGASKKKVGK